MNSKLLLKIRFHCLFNQFDDHRDGSAEIPYRSRLQKIYSVWIRVLVALFQSIVMLDGVAVLFIAVTHGRNISTIAVHSILETMFIYPVYCDEKAVIQYIRPTKI